MMELKAEVEVKGVSGKNVDIAFRFSPKILSKIVDEIVKVLGEIPGVSKVHTLVKDDRLEILIDYAGPRNEDLNIGLDVIVENLMKEEVEKKLLEELDF